MEEKIKELKSRLAEISAIQAAHAILHWDQATYMPPGGATARAREISTIGKIAQERFTDPVIGNLLDDLETYADSLPYDSDDACLIRVTRREFDRMTKVPPEFMGSLFSHSAESYQVWTQARPENDFTAVQSNLEKTLDLSRQLAEYFPGYEHIADPLIDFSDYGMRASDLRILFAELRQQLTPIIEAIASQPPADDSCLRSIFPVDDQMTFSKEVIERMGYDFKRGRIDMTHHPFQTTFSLGDVRITTRAQEDFLGEALFSTFHEAGHAMYEQGIRPELDATPLASGTSSGVHESQSRLWENIVGRSRGFWEYWYPRLTGYFPEQLGGTPLDTFYKAINKVERSLIRTDADEVTYNLHVMIRFDLELALLEGDLAIHDLPEAWNERYRADLGILPPDNRDGVLQDVHWFAGVIGGSFQGYTIGNILGAQFFEAANNANPSIQDELKEGKYYLLHGWLKEHIYQNGSKFTASELLERITGGPLNIEPYMRYLKTKYGELYEL
jgi:carboxypeptidase Taq